MSISKSDWIRWKKENPLWLIERNRKISQARLEKPRYDMIGENNPAKRPDVREKIGKTESETKVKLFAEGKLTIWSKGLTKVTDKRIHTGIHPKTEFKKGHKSRTQFTSEQVKGFWLNPLIRERMIRGIIKSLNIRPTSLEYQFINFIQQNNLPYKYVGDGSFLIGYKNPDFININGEKICIETASKFYKQKNSRYKNNLEYEKERIAHFKKYGWKCIIIFAELKHRKWNYNKTEDEILGLLRGSVYEKRNIA